MKIRELMDKAANIRNMSVIAHGKLDTDTAARRWLEKLCQKYRHVQFEN